VGILSSLVLAAEEYKSPFPIWLPLVFMGLMAIAWSIRLAAGNSNHGGDDEGVNVASSDLPHNRLTERLTFAQNAETVDTSNNCIDFGRPHRYRFEAGTRVQYHCWETPIGGLSNGNTYHIRCINETTVALYGPPGPKGNSDALDDIRRVNLSSTGSGEGVFLCRAMDVK
jgi:hypothetical protein